MSLRNTATQWGSISKSFHWSIVLLLLGQGVLGLVMGDFGRELRSQLVPLHKSIGMLILLLALARLAWALGAGRPGAVPGVSLLNHRLAALGHVALYLLLLTVPLSGWLLSDWAGRPVDFFGLFRFPALVGENRDLRELAGELHEILFWLLTVAAAGHALAALYHHFFKNDDTLRRMLPGRRG
ncbi:cytochrome b [Lysobacter pythonis]|uniref:Cytochrome b n=1 Tax=Solilutibacter pythonis TaxID=2483112 RepID=A0A3M2HI28_9GAMM|nr:cytochrome b/b6 domain-containing protein [Lysobacter pythonis]RMH88638.1 cytochrome b [Lysobacter pythonis]